MMSITVSDKAVTELHRVMKAKDDLTEEAGLRLGVKGGGCAGFSYVMSLNAKPGLGDEILEESGIRLFVDPKSYLYLEGTELDFNDGLQDRGFVFRNPNSSGTCGCGASFSA